MKQMALKLTLPLDVWYMTARDYIANAKDTFNLARTCHSLWAALEKQIYFTDVVEYKSLWDDGKLQHIEYDKTNEHVVDQWFGPPITPDNAIS